MKIQYLEVKVDINDGDIVTRRSLVSEEQLNRFYPLFSAILTFQPYMNGLTSWIHHHKHNFPVGDVCRDDLGEKTARELYVDTGVISSQVFDEFENNFLPITEYGFHTIVSIVLLVVESELRLV